MNNKSIFNISIVEIMLILFFMFISISIYQLTYKNHQISELNQIVESEREIIEELVRKDYPKLENKIDDLVNLEQCKKENIVLKGKNTGIDYLAHKMSQDVKNADVKKHSEKYDNFKNEKIKLDAQISSLKSNPLTINVLTQLHQQDKPLHQQIVTLEQKVKDNYGNRMVLVNKIKKLESDAKIKYILAKLDKNDLPVHEQITAIGKELNQLNQNRLGKNYNTNTSYILDNLQQNNKPLDQQIDALKQSLENKNLLREIENLKRQLARNLKTGNENLNIKNMKEALNNLHQIKNNPSQTRNPNTQNILDKTGMNNLPINQQINNLKNKLDLDTQLNKQLAKNLQVGNNNLNTAEMKKALNNLGDMKNNHTNSYTPDTKNVLKKLDMDNKPLHKQINTLEKKLDLDKKLKKQLSDNLKMKSDDLNPADMKKALDNLQKMQNKNTNEYEPSNTNKQNNTLKQNNSYDSNNAYDPSTKDVLKKLGMNNKPLLEQINKLKNKLDLDKDLKNQLANNLKTDNENLNPADVKKALDNLQKMQNKNTNEYDPNNTNKQNNTLKKNNSYEPNNTYDPSTKDVLKKLDIDNKPLAEQINKLKDKIALEKQPANNLKKQIKELEKQINKGLLSKDPNINKKSIEKALADLDRAKNADPDADKIYRDNLQGALDGIKEIQKIKDRLSNKISTKPVLNQDINDAIQYLEDKAKQPKLKATKDVQSTLDKFNIKDKPTDKQLSELYKNLYSTPLNNTNVSELNFIIKRLNNQNDLNNRLNYVNDFLGKTNEPSDIGDCEDNDNDAKDANNFKDGIDGKDRYSSKDIETLKNQVKYLQKKIEKNGVTHLPCFIDDEGSSIFLFQLHLRDANIYIELGEHESVPELSEGLPNMDKLLNHTMSLKKFMKLTKPIFEQSVQDECRHFVFFIDETVSKKQYKRKTLSIQHHFYKHIDHSW